MDFSSTFGWLASTLMLATFSCDSQRVMRLIALAANLCFITYGSLNNLMPVVVLHMLLFPINLSKLMAQYRQELAAEKSDGDIGHARAD